VQVYYERLYDEIAGPRYASSALPPGSDPACYQRQHAAVKYLTDHYYHARECCPVSGLTGPKGGIRFPPASPYPNGQQVAYDKVGLAVRAIWRSPVQI
jgi:hypothetical protein